VPKIVDHSGASGTVGLLIYHQHLSAAFDSLGVWHNSPVLRQADEMLARMMTAITGIFFVRMICMLPVNASGNLERLYNIREGFTSKDEIPYRSGFTEEPLKSRRGERPGGQPGAPE